MEYDSLTRKEFDKFIFNCSERGFIFSKEQDMKYFKELTEIFNDSIKELTAKLNKCKK